MRHRRRRSRLARTIGPRSAMISNLATAVLQHGRVQTTLPKAKEIRPIVERIITLGKKGTLHARRRALRIVHDETVVSHVFSELASRFAERPGGYTRIYKLGYRHGDAAPMALIEVLPADVEETEEADVQRGGLRGVVDRLRGRRPAEEPAPAASADKAAGAGEPSEA